MHGAEHVVLGTFEPDIDRVARESKRRARRRLETGELGLMIEMTPEEGGQYIGQAEIQGHGDNCSRRQAPVRLFRRHLAILAAPPPKGNVGWTLLDPSVT